MCTDCEPVELMCCDCLTFHKTMKATKKHSIETSLKTYKPDEQISAGETKMCEPCTSNSKDVTATHFCTECEEFLCHGCFGHHQQLNATSKHLIITAEEYQNNPANNRLECGLCLNGGKHKDAVAMCTDCEPVELMCCDCLTFHKTMKATKKHSIETSLKTYKPDEQISAGETKMCEPCTSNSKDVTATHFCTECEEFLCHGCFGHHQQLNATSKHLIITAEEYQNNPANNRLECGLCLNGGKHKDAVAMCTDCDPSELMCCDCLTLHKTMKATKKHNIETSLKTYKPDEQISAGETKMCEPCTSNSKDVTATHFCTECEEFLCHGCFGHHQQLNATSKHLIITAEEYQNNSANNRLECGLCLNGGKHKDAVAMCTDCDPSELMCCDCLTLHKTMKATKKHNIETSLKTYRPDEQKKRTNEDDLSNSRSQATEMSKVKPYQPGKPHAGDSQEADSIHLMWSPPQSEYDSFQYQIRYKTTSPSDRWKFYQENFDECSVILTKLKSNTKFIFQVRMVANESEGPYSEESDEIKTNETAANSLIGFSSIVPNSDGKIEKRKLPLEEIKQARNEKAKTRSFYLGASKTMYGREQTILLVGATGTGKSTLVDCFVNYILGVNWDDPFRFTLVDLEEDEKGVSKNQALSQTQWITAYCINPQKGSRLNYKLNIIDTPGFGDTKGDEHDKKIVEQLEHLFKATDETGIVFVDAVCFIVKASDVRLTNSQRYIFTSIMSLFAKDIVENIMILTTFADGKAPAVLAALKEDNIACDLCFQFNNSRLFADNTGSKMSSMSQALWEMGFNSLTSFFDTLRTMPTKSLKKSGKVLSKRRKLEITIENVDIMITEAMLKVDTLDYQLEQLKTHKADIVENKDFDFKTKIIVQEVKGLPRGKRDMTCLNCKETCHRLCDCTGSIKYMCSAIDWWGNCSQCANKCGVAQHERCSFTYVNEVKEVTQSIAEKKKKLSQGQ